MKLCFILLAALVLPQAQLLAQEPVQSFEYEACEEGKNDYFEALLARQPDEIAFPNSPDQCRPAAAPLFEEATCFEKIKGKLEASEVPSECVLASMRQAPKPYKGIFYGQCAEGVNSVPNPRACRRKLCGSPPPCRSEALHRFVYKSFVTAMKCISMPVAEIFPVVNLESSFQVNVGNSAGAWGVAQLTGAGVAEVNRKSRLAEYANKPECALIRGVLESPIHRKESCDRIGLPENPLRSFIYGGLIYKTYKNVARRVAKTWANTKLSKREREGLVLELTRYMYNGGPGGIEQAFSAFIADEANASLDLSQFKDRFAAFLGENYLRSENETDAQTAKLVERRAEVGNYAKRMERMLKFIEQTTGVRCSK